MLCGGKTRAHALSSGAVAVVWNERQRRASAIVTEANGEIGLLPGWLIRPWRSVATIIHDLIVT